MSNTPEYSQTPGPSTSDVVTETFLWRRKKLSLMVLVMATATWVVMEVYQFNFVTLASWASIFMVTSLFLWGTALRLLGKEQPELLSMGISEQTAMDSEKAIRAWAKEGIRWMFRVGAERDWFTFAGVVAGLWVLSRIGAFFDLLTLVYIAVVSGMTVPPLYVRHEDKISQLREKMKTRSRRLYERVDEKVFRNIKCRFQAKEETKEKKTEQIQLAFHKTGDAFSKADSVHGSLNQKSVLTGSCRGDL